MNYVNARKNAPVPGTVLARYRAKGFLEAGEDKNMVIDLLLTNPRGAESAINMLKARSIKERSAVQVCLSMAEDLKTKSKEEVLKFPYPVKIETLLWMKKEDIPDDLHWDFITMKDVNDLKKD